MEFLLAVKEILDAKAVNLRDKDCDKKILKAYTKLMQSETDVLQLQEYKNIIHPLCGNVSLFYEIYSAYNVSLANNDQFFALEKTIENIADKLDKNNISCFSYSYFMYAILSYIASKDSAVNNLRIDSVRWINPEDYNYGYNVKMSTDEITFGQGRYRDRLGDFEIDSGKLLKYKGKNTYVIIPSFVNALGKDAFRDNKNVRLVYIPNTVTTIEKNAFSGCENIETVGLSKNVTSLPDGAFRGCTLLKRINCDNLISIGDDCFFDCKKFRGARFSSLESVGARAFAGCESIANFEFVSQLKSIGNSAFWGASMDSVTLSNCESLDVNAFIGCVNVTKVVINTPIASVGASPFIGCVNVEELELNAELAVRPYELFERSVEAFNEHHFALKKVSLVLVGDEEFKDCKNVEQISVKSGAVVPISCFENCESLAQVTFDSEITHIFDRAFCNCVNLSELNIKYLGDAIGNYSFYACKKLDNFAFLDTVSTFGAFCLSRTDLRSFNFKRKFVKIDCFAFGNSIFVDKINLEFADCEVYVGAFHGVKNIRMLKISSLQNIKPNLSVYQIFEKSVDLFSRISIDYLIVGDNAIQDAFRGYGNVRYIECKADGVIPSGAFCECENVEAIKINGSVENIEDQAFCKCEKLENLDVTYESLQVGNSAFESCYSVESLIDFSKMTSVGDRAFANTKVQNANFSNVRKQLGMGALCNCFDVKELTLPSCDLLISDGKYNGIDYLFLETDGNFYINDTFRIDNLTLLTTQLPSYAMSGVDYVNNLNLPYLIAFDYLDLDDKMNLTSINFGKHLKSFSAKSFMNLTNEITINIHEECANFAVINNSVVSKDATQLYYLSKQDDYENYSDGLKVLHSFAIMQGAIDSLELKGGLVLKDNAVQAKQINSLKLSDRLSFSNLSFESVENVGLLSVSYWRQNYKDAFKNAIIDKINIGSLCSCMQGVDYKEVEIGLATLTSNVFDCSHIGALTINSVDNIQAYAFDRLTVDKLTLKNVRSIQPNAFTSCNIGEIEILDSLPYVIADGYLYGDSELIYCFDANVTEIFVQNNVRNVCANAFEKCENLEYFESAFDGLCVDTTALEACKKLSRIKVGKLNNATLSEVFGYDRLKQIVYCSDSVPYKYFYKQYSLESVVLQRAQTVDDMAFSCCENLREIEGIENVINFGDMCFYNCLSLSSVALSSDCSKIGLGCFAGCENLVQITKPVTAFERDNGLSYEQAVGRVGENVHVTGDISDGYFSNCYWLKDIELADGCSKIGREAFGGCSCISSMVIPDSVSEIGERIFERCDSLKNLTLPFVGRNEQEIKDISYLFASSDNCALRNIVITKSDKLALGMFEFASLLKTIRFGCPVAGIPDKCFYGLSNLTDVVNIGLVIEIGESAFCGCEKITSLSFSNLQQIGTNAFSKCAGLKKLSLPFIGESIDNPKPLSYLLGDNSNIEKLVIKGGQLVSSAFSGYSSLKAIEFSGELESVPDSCFAGLVNLSELTIPNAKNVEDRAFKDCKELDCFDFENMQNVGIEAFSGCSNIRKVDLKNAIRIGENAFSKCVGLKELSLPFVGESIDNPKPLSYLLGDNNSKVEKISVATGKLVEDAFSGFRSVVDLSLNYEDTTIAKGCFSGMSKLSTISGLGKIISVEDCAFKNCALLQNFDFSEVESIGQEAFAGTDIRDVVLTEKCINIGKNAFYGCNKIGNLAIVVMGENYLSGIGISTQKLREVTILGGELYSSMFEGSKELVSVKTLNNVTSIPSKCFSGCTSLTNIAFDNITKIGERAFEGCLRIKKANLNKLTSLGESAFANSGLEEITLNKQLEVIPDRAFALCASLIKIELPTSLKALGSYAFEGTNMFKIEILVPKTLVQVGEYVFKDAKTPIIRVNKAQEASWTKNWKKGCKRHGIFFDKVIVKNV